jgi:MFS family permease
MLMQAGMWLGYVLFGFLSDRLGRRRTYVGYLLVAALLVPFYAQAQGETLLLLGPVLAFFGTGHFTGFGIIAAELFPTEIRASAMGLAYNFGRVFSAGAPWMLGVLAGRAGIDSSFWICSLAFAAAATLALKLPETRGRSLA